VTKKRVLLGLVAMAAFAFALAWPSGASPRATAPSHRMLTAQQKTFSFSLHKVGPQAGGGEPSIAIDPQGIIYVSYPSSPGMSFYRSLDDGKTWTQGAFAQTSSGDTSVNTDSSGAVYQSNLNGGALQDLLQVDIFKSFNRGNSWPIHGKSQLESSNSSGQPFFVDRQWTDAWIPPGKTTTQSEVCVSYHDWAPGTVWASCSFDGGKTYDTPVNVITDPVAVSDSACDTIPGGTRIVQSGPHAGRIYVAWLAADPANPATGCNETQGTAFHSVWLASSDDKGQTWSDHLAFDGGPLHDGSEIFADLALDNAGNPYLAFTMNIKNSQEKNDQYDTWLVASFDGGKTWNGKTDGTGEPYKVSCCKGTHYFPSVAAGDPGHVVLAWLHTWFVTPALPNGKPDFTTQSNANWRVVTAQTVNLKSGNPTWKIREYQKFVHHGNICTLGIACPPGLADRSLLDFIDIAVDPQGMAHAVFTSAGAPKDGGLPNGVYILNQSTGPAVGRGAHS
jgi:hypothetical protein